MIKQLFILAFATGLHGYGENYEELTTKVRTLEWEHFQYLNELRANGFKCPLGHVYEPNPEKLVFDCRLWKTAQEYSKQMGADDHFEHDGKDGSTFVSRANANGIYSSGENLSGGYLKPYNILMGFLYSDGHCMNLGRTSFKLFGGGFFNTAGSKYEHYFTQMYAPESEKPADTSCYPDDITPTVAPTPAFKGMWGRDGEGPIRKHSSNVVRNGGWDPVQCQVVRDGDVKCSHCFTTSQCQDAYDKTWFCCPYLKKCIKSNSFGGFDGCGGPPADCIGDCDENDPFGCTCYNQDFPRNWMKGCQDPTLTPAPTREDGQIYNEHKCWKKTTDDMVCVLERPISIMAMKLDTCMNNYYNYQCDYVKWKKNWCWCIKGDGEPGCQKWVKYTKGMTHVEAGVYVNRYSQYFKPDDSDACKVTDNGDPQIVEVFPPIQHYTANPTEQPIERPEETGIWNPLTCVLWSRANCEPCFTDAQCRFAFRMGETGSKWFCDVKEKMCKLKEDPDMYCGEQTALCDESCDDSKDPMTCNCKNTHFPRSWVRGCHDPTIQEEIEYNEDGWIVSEGQCWEEYKDQKCTGGSYGFVANNFEIKDCVNKFHNNQCTAVIYSGYGACKCMLNCRWRAFQDSDYRAPQSKYLRKCTPKDPEGQPIVKNARPEVWVNRGVGQCGYIRSQNQWFTSYTSPKKLRSFSRIRNCKYECEIEERCTHYATDVNTEEEKFGDRGLHCYLYDDKEKGMMLATGRTKSMNCYARLSAFQEELTHVDAEKTVANDVVNTGRMSVPPQPPVSGTLGGAINDWGIVLLGCAMFAFVLGGILSFLKSHKGNNVEVDEGRGLLAA